MNLELILEKKVSFQSNVSSALGEELTILQVLNDIKSNKYREQITELRSYLDIGEVEKYDRGKKELPSVTFCATFQGTRNKNCLKKYNNIIVIDIDKLNAAEFLRAKSVLDCDNYVFAYWESPSQKGFKGLVYLSFNFEIDDNNIDNIHKYSFRKLSSYFLNKYELKLDVSGSDIPRLCFLSFDPNLVIKDLLTEFEIDNVGIDNDRSENKIHIRKINTKKRSNDALLNPLNKNSPINRKKIQSIIRYLSKRNLSITSSYDEWYRVAFAIADTFTFDIGSKYYLSLCKLDIEKFDTSESINLLENIYYSKSEKIHFNSIIYYATLKGYQDKSKKRGVPKTAASYGTS